MTGRIHWRSAALIVSGEQHNYQTTARIHCTGLGQSSVKFNIACSGK